MPIDSIKPGWSGIVTEDSIEPLAQAIEQQFAGKSFSIMSQSHYSNIPFPQGLDANFHRHYRINEIKPLFHDHAPPCIWIVARTNWSIDLGSLVCLSQKGLFVERVVRNGYQVWCWILEKEHG